MPSIHTSGPWTIDPEWNHGLNIYSTTDSECGGIVATASCAHGPVVAESNAKLIAAAPDMLSLLKHYLPTIVDEEKSRCADLSYLIRDIRAAITKAEGRP